MEKGAASYVDQPLKLSQLDQVQWADEADVVVVGYGGAGVCTALEANAHGADVLAIDRFGGGGATALSGGIVYGGGTSYQRTAGLNDTAEEMYNYLKQEIGDAVKSETLRRFCDQSDANFAWLVANGLSFGSRVFEGKRSYPPKGYDIYYSGNESSPLYTAKAKAFPRGHRVSGSGYTGKDFFLGLSQTALARGVRLSTHTVVNRLIVDSSDRVVGVEAIKLPAESEALKKHQAIIKKVNAYQRFMEKAAINSAAKAREIEQISGEKIYIRAKKAVVLTTGSFAFNREMVRYYAPAFGQAMPLGTIGCDGSGVVLGQSVGASVGHMDSATAWRSISPSESFVKAVVVNKQGRRFVAEDTYLGHLGNAIARQDEQRAWLIIDSATYWGAFKETLPRLGEEGYLEFRGPLLLNLLINTTRGKTLKQLGEKLGLDSEAIVDEVATYNQSVAAGQNDAFSKKPANCRALNEGSYYAIDISLGSQKFKCPTIPMGGLEVNEETGQVLSEAGGVIEGLYAAGRAAVGIPSGFYVSGSSLADCVFSGRRAGRHATELSQPTIN